MKKLLTLLIIVIVSMQYSTAQQIGKITKSDCFLVDCSVLDNGANIEFGHITVPADYSNPDKNTYQIAFVVIKARNNNSKQDPILNFVGGWGISGISDVAFYSHHKLTEDRDMILYDYRGLGYSEPDLSKIKPDYDDEKRPNSPEKIREYTTRRTNKILDALEDNSIDVNMFGTDTNAKDGLLLAENLGYESYNLLGISNGTLVIQNFIRYAEGKSIKIRAAILDSNVPIGFPLHAETSTNFANSLNYILSDCAKDPRCNEKYPDLKIRYKNLLQSLDVNPIKIKPDEGDSIDFGKENANNILLYMLYRRNLYQYIPLVMESMINKDRGAILKYFAFAGDTGSSASEFVSPIIYIYDVKLMRDKMKSLSETIILEDPEFIIDDPLRDFYYSDERIKQDSLSTLPIKTDVPSLILAGSYDPVTPPLWSERIRSSFTNHYYFNIPKMGHGIIRQPCGVELVLAFLKNPNEKPENNCEITLGENNIDFILDYYKNLKIETLLKDLFRLNWFLIIALALVIILCFISCISGMIKLIRKRSTPVGNWITANSFLILATLIGIAVIVSQTLSENPVLLILGLNKSADYLLWLVPIIIIISLIIIFQLLLKKEFKLLQKLSLGAFVIFGVLVFNYGLFPNLW